MSCNIGTGRGGNSIWGKKFEDEYSEYLKVCPQASKLFFHAMYTLGNSDTYVVVTQVNITSEHIYTLFCGFCTLGKWYQGENINGSSSLKYILKSHHHMDVDIKWAHLWVQPEIFNQKYTKGAYTSHYKIHVEWHEPLAFFESGETSWLQYCHYQYPTFIIC